MVERSGKLLSSNTSIKLLHLCLKLGSLRQPYPAANVTVDKTPACLPACVLLVLLHGQPEGEGKYEWSDGSCYEGGWKVGLSGHSCSCQTSKLMERPAICLDVC